MKQENPVTPGGWLVDMDAGQEQLLMRLCAGEIDAPSFLRDSGLGASDVPLEVARCLSEASANQDSDGIECALLLGFSFTMPDNIRDILHELVAEPWHTSHEDMIGILQNFAHASSIPYLVRAIQLKPSLQYLDYDDYGSYYKKCLWALHAIGTPAAFEAIKNCATASDSTLSEQAEYRLRKMR